MLDLDFSFLSWQVVNDYLLSGFLFSLRLTIVAAIGGILLGTMIALMRLSNNKILSISARVYVDIMRSIPLPMVILWFFLVVPLLIGRSIGAEASAYITFIAFEAAFFSEIARAGIKSVGTGQVYASQAVGMNYQQTMRLVILPQAFRNMLPVFLTQTLILFQDTSLVYVVGSYDLLKGFEMAGKNYGRSIETYLLAAAVYFIVCFSLSQAVKYLQNRISIVR